MHSYSSNNLISQGFRAYMPILFFISVTWTFSLWNKWRNLKDNATPDHYQQVLWWNPNLPRCNIHQEHHHLRIDWAVSEFSAASSSPCSWNPPQVQTHSCQNQDSGWCFLRAGKAPGYGSQWTCSSSPGSTYTPWYLWSRDRSQALSQF